MEAELAALAGSGAATLIGLMVTDSWTQVKERLTRFFASKHAAEDMVRELDISRSEVVAAYEAGNDGMAADVEAQWRLRLRRLLLSDPVTAAELLRLLGALDSELRAPRTNTVRNVVSGGVQFGPVIQSGRISGLAFHTPPAPPLEERATHPEAD
ncbi:hypothetical protein HS041_14690 [Planomonospora sp. ID67723]|uniref:hypothetical protein n=1 Tax=Planomonospora sp. ID67723 TaxID=2738134 RepID=UPI0018C3972C|nr:hypothetical protein [Planomonospora sp. ID67723]MBG0829018.1 hypothetical protein [Planomonospora sp. ID67723]